MRFLSRLSAALLALSAMPAVPAMAEVHDSDANGFAVRATATVPASPEEAWDELLDPAEWWNGTSTFSGDAANLSLDPRAGGCFCEVLPNTANQDEVPRGGVQHMQVAYLEKPRTLRMIGALGPLQSEPVTGVLTFIIKPDASGTRINAEYAVGGFMRIPSARMAPIVDRMITDQLGRLAKKLGGTVADPKPVAKPEEPRAPDTADAPTAKPIIGR